MPQPLIVAITLNWNRPDDTLVCVESLLAQTYGHLAVVVVDNGSTDDSVAQVQARFPQVAVIANETNLGFAGGMNVGLRWALAAGADFALIVNNDTLLATDMVARLGEVAQAERAVTAPIIYYADEPQRVWSLGARMNDWTLEEVGNVRGQVDVGQWAALVPCNFVPGCAMFFPREVLETVGLFDEGFFMYYEDSDLCLRLTRGGWPILSVTGAKMWHKVAVSSGGSDSVNERYWMARSSVRFFSKHARWWQGPIVLFWRTGSAVRTTWRLWRHGRMEALKAYWRGLADGLRGLGR
ncbi:MAG: glycosyltransferase family 2 protein [Ardenticatenaceae bacterium]|nr:glycosyltransferase family 2 protein [Ardenticatenaceae bacterium]